MIVAIFFHLMTIPLVIRAHETVNKVASHFMEGYNYFQSEQDVWGNYTLDLTLESLLLFDHYTGGKEYTSKVLKIMEMRGLQPGDTVDYKTQPFCSIDFTLFIVTQNQDYVQPYVHQTNLMMEQVGRTREGAICHSHKGDTNMLIDYLQEYASRVAKTGYLIDNEMYYNEAVHQFKLYERILRDPQTGLWSQGRGWLEEEMELSPGAWSRGHGWLIRGLVTTLMHLPEGSNWQQDLTLVLQRLCDALLEVQDENGMWHQLLDYPFEVSAPETSGTGMIAYYMALAIEHGYIEAARYKGPVLKAINAMKTYVKADGTITYTCKGPGPLYSVEGYVGNIPEPDDHHGPQAFIYAMIGETILQK